jgi:hypothetical protein
MADRTRGSGPVTTITRAQRLDYERRILSAEVETVRLAQRAKRFAELIQRNTQTLDAALCLANARAEREGYDRLVVEPWIPALLSLLDDIRQILPDEDDNLNRLLSEEQPKSVDAFDALYVAAANPRQPIFRDHNCWKCRDGELPCTGRRDGDYGRCEYPHARND